MSETSTTPKISFVKNAGDFSALVFVQPRPPLVDSTSPKALLWTDVYKFA